MKIIKKLFTSLALFAITAPLCAQDYSMSLEGITKVVISAETTIIVKQHNKTTFLITEAENYRDPITKKAKGLKATFTTRNNNTNFGAEVKKEGNLLIVKGTRQRREANLVVYLPKSMNISVESLANNEIYINGFSSEIEAINYQGATILANITGPIVTQNNNGNITVKFDKVNQLSPMSIVAENGDIDIRMPPNAIANITSKTPRGEFYTNFNLEIVNKKRTRTNRRSVKGKLNNGGVEITLQNLKGNIYLRKLK
jgi:hypothetical protein